MITLTEEQFKEMIEAAHRAGQHNQGHCDPSAYEAMVYYERDVKKLIIPDVMGSALFNSIGEWSKNAFPDAGSIEHIIKLKHEAQEVIEAPYDIKEYADCIIALLAAAYKADISFFELIEAVETKLEVNKNRKWTKLSDGTYQHCL